MEIFDGIRTDFNQIIATSKKTSLKLELKIKFKYNSNFIKTNSISQVDLITLAECAGIKTIRATTILNVQVQVVPLHLLLDIYPKI